MISGTHIVELKPIKTMTKIEKRDYSLYGLVYPNDMSVLKKKLENIADAIIEIYSQEDPEQLKRVEFNFEKISKGDVYKLLVSARRLPNGIRCSERKLSEILAVFTNLADNPVCSKRINAIRRSYKRYKKLDRKWTSTNKH